MKPNRLYWGIGAISLFLAMAVALPAGVSGIAIQDISPRSPLTWLVDSEITGLPTPQGAHLISYRSEPNDGNKPSVSAVRFQLETDGCKCDVIVRHLVALGYTHVSQQEFQREEQSISIRVEKSNLDIIKYGGP